MVSIDAGYYGAHKRKEVTGVAWQVAMRPGKRWTLDTLNKTAPIDALMDKLEQRKASIRPKVEHSFRVV